LKGGELARKTMTVSCNATAAASARLDAGGSLDRRRTSVLA
jgi:hypothetical protein